jgi:hypothetical protein
VFTQTKWDEEGYPIRDPDSTTCVGAIETAGEFGKRLYVEAWKRGWERPETKVVLGDGAEWIRNLAGRHSPGAIRISDLYRARQRLWEVARKLHPNDEARRKRWIMVRQNRLDKGRIEKPALALRSIQTTNPEVAEKLRTLAEYFERNAERMRYPKFRSQHLFVGLGAIETGCKTVIGSRLKQSGILPTVRKLLGGAPAGLICTSYVAHPPPGKAQEWKGVRPASCVGSAPGRVRRPSK